MDLRKIEEELSKSRREEELVERNIESMERDYKRTEIRIQAATNDRNRAAEALKKLETDLKRAIDENDHIRALLIEAKKKKEDYATKVRDLEKDVRNMKYSLDFKPNAH